MMNENERATLSTATDEDRFFPNAKLTRLEIELFEGDLKEMRDYLARGQFEHENEGWRYLLAAGYAYLRGQREILTADQAGLDRDGIRKSMARLLEIESMYAVMKQRAYQWMKDHQAMELSYNAVRIKANGMERRAWELLEENQTLRAEAIRLREQVERLTPAQPSVPEAAPAALPFWKRWLRRIAQ
jgi:hypothetical protein